MRRLILLVIAGLFLPGPAMADSQTDVLCRPIQGEWESVAGGSNVAAMDREIAKIPPLCAGLKTQAQRRLNAVRAAIKASAPRPSPPPRPRQAAAVPPAPPEAPQATPIRTQTVAGDAAPAAPSPAFLGVGAENLTEAHAAPLGLSGRTGAYITSVVHGGPADAAGIRVGDIVIAVDNTTIVSGKALLDTIASTTAGATARLVVLRGDETQVVVVRLAAMPETLRDVRASKDAYVRQDYAEAMRLARLAADAGDVDGQVLVGFLYQEGRGVAQDDSQAMHWYRLAADQGLAGAQGRVGLLYAQGLGVAQDDIQAMHWYRLAADQGDAPAQYEVGAAYRAGKGVTLDDAQAMHWLGLAADQGNEFAETLVGYMYDKGEGVAADPAQAMHWYQLGANQGDADAQTDIAILYLAGRGVPKDYVQAAHWYRLAADQGAAQAQYSLGILFAGGLGVTQDPVEARALITKAAAQNYDLAKTWLAQHPQ